MTRLAPRQRRFRRVGRTVVAIVLGTVLTVVTAWGFALIGAVELNPGRRHICASSTTPDWRVIYQHAIGSSVVHRSQSDDARIVGPSPPYWYDTTAEAWPNLALPGALSSSQFTEQAFGFPFRAMSLQVHKSWSAPAGGPDLRFGWQLPDTRWTKHPVPLAVIVPGFIANVLIASFLVYMLLALPLAARRWMRHHRGRCRACGYELRASGASTCSECGTAVHA